jgi:hypothetical protein
LIQIIAARTEDHAVTCKQDLVNRIDISLPVYARMFTEGNLADATLSTSDDAMSISSIT